MKCLLLLAALSSVALADPKPAKPVVEAKPTIENTFGFDAMKPKTKCAKVTGALLKKLNTSYTCTAPDGSVGTASGKVQLAGCKAKKGKSEFMLFATTEDCTEERETQLANGG
jgi:hypothetical protein